MSEEKLVDIESKLAHLDKLLAEFDEVVTDQQARIMKLEELYAALVDRLRAIGEASPRGAADDERPPHY